MAHSMINPAVEPVTPETISELLNFVPTADMATLMTVLIAGDEEKIQEQIDYLHLQESFEVEQISQQLWRQVVDHAALSDELKSRICIQLAELDQRLLDGRSDPYLHLSRACLHISKWLPTGAVS